MLYLIILLAFVFFASVAMCVNEGLWSNTIALVGVLLSGIGAVLFGGPLGVLAAEKAGTADALLWYFVFGLTWLVFALFILIFRTLAEKLSCVRMKFIPQLDQIAGILMAVFVAVMFTSFAAFTLMRIPIKAGEWDLKDASDWQRSAMRNASAPFYTVVKRYAKAEKLEMSLLEK